MAHFDIISSHYHLIIISLSFAKAPLIRSTGAPQYTTSTKQSNKIKFKNMIKHEYIVSTTDITKNLKTYNMSLK